MGWENFNDLFVFLCFLTPSPKINIRRIFSPFSLIFLSFITSDFLAVFKFFGSVNCCCLTTYSPIIIQEPKFADTWAIKNFEIFSLHFLSCPDQSVIASYMILKTDKIAELDNIEGLSTGEWVWSVKWLYYRAMCGQGRRPLPLSRTHRHSILSLHCIHDLYRLNKTPIISGRDRRQCLFSKTIHSTVCRHGGAHSHRHPLLLDQLHGLRDRKEVAAEGGWGAEPGAAGGRRGTVRGDDHHRDGAGGAGQVSPAGQYQSCKAKQMCRNYADWSCLQYMAHLCQARSAPLLTLF